MTQKQSIQVFEKQMQGVMDVIRKNGRFPRFPKYGLRIRHHMSHFGEYCLVPIPTIRLEHRHLKRNVRPMIHWEDVSAIAKTPAEAVEKLKKFFATITLAAKTRGKSKGLMSWALGLAIMPTADKKYLAWSKVSMDFWE